MASLSKKDERDLERLNRDLHEIMSRLDKDTDAAITSLVREMGERGMPFRNIVVGVTAFSAFLVGGMIKTLNKSGGAEDTIDFCSRNFQRWAEEAVNDHRQSVQ